MKAILLGKNGQLGYEFRRFLEGKVELFAFSHKELDILNVSILNEKIREIRPDVVINCAAYTKVDRAEEEGDLAYEVNSIGAKNVSFTAFRVGAKCVYFSTDYVFDGENDRPYTEFDRPNPVSIYGKSKLLGERYTAEFDPDHLILRISWLYGAHGVNFVKTMIRLAKEGKPLRIVNDQFGTPTYTLDVVRQTWKLIRDNRVGLYHSTNDGKATWFEFAKEIASMLNLNVDIVPIKTEEYPTLARRPKYSVLENHLLKLENSNIMREWKEALRDFMNGKWVDE